MLGTQKVEAERLVVAARNGDQNAMDAIYMIAKSAEKGSEKAKISKQVIEDYIRKHPVTDSSMGGEASITCGIIMACDDSMLPYWMADLPPLGNEAVITAIMILVHGKPLTNSRIRAMAEGIKEETLREIFLWGVAFCGKDRGCKDILRSQDVRLYAMSIAGKAVGYAQKVQSVAFANGEISKVSDLAAWEHGE